MDRAVQLLAETQVFEVVDVGGVNASARDEGVEAVGGIGVGAEERSKELFPFECQGGEMGFEC